MATTDSPLFPRDLGKEIGVAWLGPLPTSPGTFRAGPGGTSGSILGCVSTSSHSPSPNLQGRGVFFHGNCLVASLLPQISTIYSTSVILPAPGQRGDQVFRRGRLMLHGRCGRTLCFPPLLLPFAFEGAQGSFPGVRTGLPAVCGGGALLWRRVWGKRKQPRKEIGRGVESEGE